MTVRRMMAIVRVAISLVALVRLARTLVVTMRIAIVRMKHMAMQSKRGRNIITIAFPFTEHQRAHKEGASVKRE